MITFLKRYKMLVAGAAFVLLVVVASEVFAAPQRAFRTLDIPVVQVIPYQQGVGLLDTTTGEIFELRGDLYNASSRLSWFPRVAGFAGTSGFLQVQSPPRHHGPIDRPDPVFLVDAVTGATWILRDRGNHNGTWEAVLR